MTWSAATTGGHPTAPRTIRVCSAEAFIHRSIRRSPPAGIARCMSSAAPRRCCWVTLVDILQCSRGYVTDLIGVAIRSGCAGATPANGCGRPAHSKVGSETRHRLAPRQPRKPQPNNLAGSTRTALSNNHARPADRCSPMRRNDQADQGAGNGFQRRRTDPNRAERPPPPTSGRLYFRWSAACMDRSDTEVLIPRVADRPTSLVHPRHPNPGRRHADLTVYHRRRRAVLINYREHWTLVRGTVRRKTSPAHRCGAVDLVGFTTESAFLWMSCTARMGLSSQTARRYVFGCRGAAPRRGRETVRDIGGCW